MSNFTKEQIEQIRSAHAAVGDGYGDEIVALCDLALEALEMRPRPLAEIDKAETALVIERDQHSERLNVFVLNCYGSGLWKRSPASQAWRPSTLAIPLSAIPKEKP